MTLTERRAHGDMDCSCLCPWLLNPASTVRLGLDGLGRTPYLQLSKTWDDLGKKIGDTGAQENTRGYWLVSLLASIFSQRYSCSSVVSA